MKKNIFLTSIFSLAFLFAGCEKDIQDTNVGAGGSGPVPLDIVIGGTEDFGDISSPETRSADNAETMIQSFVQPLDSTQDTGIDIVTTVEMLPARNFQTRANLNNNTMFAMKVFNDKGELVADNDYNVNGSIATLSKGTPIILEPGIYKFVCFTVNLEGIVSTSDDISLVNAYDFATFCVSKNITASDHSLNIVFKRQMAQLQIDVNSNIGGSASYSSATIDRLTYRGRWPINSESNDDAEFINRRSGIIGIKKGEILTVFPESVSICTSINDLILGNTNYGSKKVFMPIKFIKKGNYKITINFNKSYPYTEIGGVKWAVSNLSYIDGKVTVNENPAENYNLVFRGGSLLGYNPANGVDAAPVVKPLEYSGTPTIIYAPSTTSILHTPAKGTGDPCRYYLGETWRLPTQEEVYVLGGTPATNGKLKNSVWRTKGTYGLQNVDGAFIGPNATSAKISGNTVTNNCIFIPALGYYNSSYNSFFEIGSRGSFWTSHASNDLLGYVGVGSFEGNKSGYYVLNQAEFGFGIRCVHK